MEESSRQKNQVLLWKQNTKQTENTDLRNVILQFCTSNFISIKVKGLEENRTFQFLQPHVSFLLCIELIVSNPHRDWKSLKLPVYHFLFFFQVENIQVTCKRGFIEHLTHLLFQDKLLFFQWPYWGLNIKMNFYRCSSRILGWILGDIN